MPPEATHLALRQLMTGMGGETGVVDLCDLRMGGEILGHHAGIRFIVLHAHLQRFDAAKRQPGSERTGNSPGQDLLRFERAEELVVVQDHRATDDIAMSIKIFGGAMYDDIGPED
jgi:hypothetical protein